MRVAEQSIDPAEARRLRALRELGLLDTGPEERFDRLTRLARRVFDVPVALVTLVDMERQWAKSSAGTDIQEIPREWSICSRAIEDGQMMIVPDARENPDLDDHPLLASEPPIRFYAGQPIAAPGGEHVGTLCLLDHRPRELSDEEVEMLSDLARLVERELAALQLATTDELTGLSNRRGFQMLAGQSLALSRRTGRAATLLIFDLDDFKEINDTLGHAAGDMALASFGADLLASFRESDVVARIGGDEFCVLLTGTEAADVPATIEKFADRIEKRNAGRPTAAHLRFSVGAAVFDPAVHATTADLIDAADTRMYSDKRGKTKLDGG